MRFEKQKINHRIKIMGQSRVGLAVAGLVVTILAVAGLYFWDSKQQIPSKMVVSVADPVVAHGLTLYSEKCAACHGEKGRGDGQAAYLLNPKPRDFGSGSFRLTSTQSGLPSDQDLMKTIQKGMPGSAMPSWAHLPKADLQDLVLAVRYLAVEGRAADLLKDDPEMSTEDAREIAKDIFSPGIPVELPARPPDSQISKSKGKQIYLSTCAPCHGKDGRGGVKGKELLDDQGRLVEARDYTQGIFKGDSSSQAIAMRIVRGLPGSPMPGNTTLSGQELWSLVDYVKTMVKPGAQEKVQQVQKILPVLKTKAALEADPESPLWKEVPSTYLALMPLWWRDNRIGGVEIQGLYNKSQIAIRLSWPDSTYNDQVLNQTAFGDGAAVQMFQGDDPPFFAMGAAGRQVNIWQWKSSWERDLANTHELQDVYPRMAVDYYDSLKKPPYGRHSEVSEFETKDHKPLYLSGWGAGNPASDPQHASSVEDLNAQGFGTLASQDKKFQGVRGKGVWKNKTWSVVFLRDLKSGKGDVRFKSKTAMSVAFAVWNGQAGDRNGQKEVTIWHRLNLEP